MTLEIQYYVDLPSFKAPHRDLSIADPGSVMWIDIETGCFEDAQDVRDQGTANTAAGLRTGIYCNRTSLVPVFGDSTELADFGLPLMYADYRPPDYANFVPFNGFLLPALWQFWSDGYLGVNADLSITPDGRLFADLSNYSQQDLNSKLFTQRDADNLKFSLDGVIIGLQNATIARMFKRMLS